MARGDRALGDVLRCMTRALTHRGPDDEGYLEDPARGVFLGHRRLSIIDLSEKGRQPLFSEDRNVAVVCNGEIYNYRELTAELRAQGHVFSSESDSEVIVHAYEEWGDDCFKKLEGMYAIALWDARKRQMLLVRDPLGIKPLLYVDTPAGLFFASEVKAFLELPRDIWTPTFDSEGLNELLTFQYLFSPGRTILSGVKKLMPGSLLRIGRESRQEQVFWELKRDDDVGELSLDDAVTRCEALLTESIRGQLHADVPVGVLLSGGLDSSLITALAAKESSHKVRTITAGFEHRLDERPFAQHVADHVGSEHTVVSVDPRVLNDRIEELIYHFDDLSSLDGGLFTICLMTEKVKELGVKVLLVGEGGDEAFAGYSWYGLSQYPYRLLPAWARSDLFYYAIARLLPNRRTRPTMRQVHAAFKSFGESDICRQVHKFDLTRELPSHFLMKEDHATMANSIEARVPYLDTRVVQFAYSLPRSYKLRGSWFNFHAVNEKFILRKVAEKHLPHEIAWRKKRGFSIPVPEVLMSNLDKVRDYLMASSSVARERYSERELEKMLRFKNRMYSPLEKHKEFMVWKLFLIEVWKTHYMRR